MPQQYRINEIFYTLQGEGHWSGRPAVFVRFSGCNLWTGVEADRAASICTFCDTDFTNFEPFDLNQLLNAAFRLFPDGAEPMVVFTGGEPALHLDQALVDAFKGEGWYTAVESNGTKPLPAVDWVCVSPKTPTLRVTSGDELKLVYPQTKVRPDLFTHLNFQHWWISPMDGPNLADNTRAAIDYCLTHPRWRLNTQTHKQIGIR